jgi:agmatinase
VFDPTARWPDGERPEYAGLPTYAALAWTEDPADLQDVDAAIVGAPFDELVSDRPGTRYGPRAIRLASVPAGPHLEAGVDPFEVLRVVDYGDAPVVPADSGRAHAAIEHVVGEVVAAGAVPIVLGGDHSITEPNVRACAGAQGPVGLIHFDTHTDTAATLYGSELSHGTPMYRVVEAGSVDPRRYVQVGLRGYWPGRAEFDWQEERGIRHFLMRDVRERGIAAVVEDALEKMGSGPVFLTVDVDVLDPAFAPGTGTPEPGGMSSAELLWACRAVSERVELVGADVVEVAPRHGDVGHHRPRGGSDRARDPDGDRAPTSCQLHLAPLDLLRWGMQRPRVPALNAVTRTAAPTILRTEKGR